MTTPNPNRIPVNIEDEMRRSYMDYAMSVIIGRALPDVRDGLKPAHRRVLYGMKAMGLSPTRGYRKCAKIVGEVMGNYHPHGDASIYDTLVRMAQDFNMRAPLVDGQGNFGSIDGDPPAAMRYTEARLDALGDEMMTDLDKETVDFIPNYDETTEEPSVLPSPFPNLLVNGSEGIAVGMATKVPPHNMREVIEGVVWLIESAYDEVVPTQGEKQRRLLEIVRGPDFPTGGYIIGRAGIQQALLTGRGTVVMRAKAEIEVSKKGDRSSIVIDAIPYQVNKARLIERIAELVREKTVEGISDIRDESDRDGMRIVIDLKRGEVGEVVLNNLYKHTALQSSFGIIMLAIVGGRPKVLSLLEMLETFVDFRREVVRRRTEFELRKAEARRHILEGLKIALDHIDAVIALIRAAKSPSEARQGLMTQFALSQIQAQAILDMQLQRLTGLERQKILDELAELLKTIERLLAILANDRLLMQIIVDELRAIQTKYGDDRRTEILAEAGEFRAEDLIVEEDMAITVSNTGYIKRTAITNYRNQRRGGKGRIGMRTRDEDFVSHLFVASTHAYIMIFSDRGRAYWLKVHEIPDVGPDGRGKAIANLVSMQEGERIAALLTVREFEEDKFIVMGTKRGEVKKTELTAFSNPRAGGIIAMNVEEGDAVIAVQVSDGTSEIFIGTRDGMAIRFRESDVRSMGRAAGGVRGIDLRDDDAVVAMEVLRPEGAMLSVTGKGYGKRTVLAEYRVQTRGGVGIINIQTSERNGAVVGVVQVTEGDELMLITQQGKILRIAARDIRMIGRATQGVRLIDIEGDDRAVSIARIAEQDADPDAAEAVVVAPGSSGAMVAEPGITERASAAAVGDEPDTDEPGGDGPGGDEPGGGEDPSAA
jgi:DNA gyrase subunit A